MVVSPTILWGLTSLETNNQVADAVRHAQNAMVRKALGIYTRLEMSWADHLAESRRRVAEFIVRCGQEPWHVMSACYHWRLLGHLAKMPADSVYYNLLRAGGLWRTYLEGLWDLAVPMTDQDHNAALTTPQRPHLGPFGRVLDPQFPGQRVSL